MNPLGGNASRQHQVAWIAFCIAGGMAELFFAWMESAARVTANDTMEANAPRRLHLVRRLKRPSPSMAVSASSRITTTTNKGPAHRRPFSFRKRSYRPFSPLV
jgi:hypothetical protein